MEDHVILELKQVTKKYDGKQIFMPVTCQMQEGEFWWIRGESGIGKTTLIRMILGLEKISDGEIIKEKDTRFSVVFQENRLLNWQDAVQNVEFACSSISRKRIIRHLKRILPEDCLEQPVNTLSGGMKRRVALVRAILAPSEIVILDEPFTGLDEISMRKAANYILNYLDGRLLLLSSHQGEEKIFSKTDYKILNLQENIE